MTTGRTWLVVAALASGCWNSVRDDGLTGGSPDGGGLPRRGPADVRRSAAVDAVPEADTSPVVDAGVAATDLGTTSPDAEATSRDSLAASPDVLGGSSDGQAVPQDAVSPRPDAGQPDACRATTYLPGQADGTTVFRDGVARGLLSGTPAVVAGARDVTVPECRADGGAGGSCAPRASGDAECLSGTVPAVPVAELGTSWGIGVRFAAGCGGAVGPGRSVVAVVVAGVPSAVVRASRLHLALGVPGASGETLYYVDDDGRGISHPLDAFNTQWWSPGTGKYLSPADAAKATSLYVMVHSSPDEGFEVGDLCVSQVAFK